MGCWNKRRVYVLFLLITVLQILTTGARQVFDFFGPLWSLILTNFLNLVFTIFGFFGGYTKRRSYLITYITWQLTWSIWNLLILLLYLQIPHSLTHLKSPILSLSTGGFSWWETRAPGCIPDWGVENSLLITNCYLNPVIVECVQAGLQVYLAVWGVIAAVGCILRPYNDNENDGVKEAPLYNRRSMRRNVAEDERLRPMTPRKVKRRSARSITSAKFGPNPSARNSLRSSSSGRKMRSQFVSPVNRLIQHQVDSETSVDDNNARVSHVRGYGVGVVRNGHQGHANPAYLDPHKPNANPSQHRPPSARSSYSNYHPARNLHTYNNHFTNAAFDPSGEVYSQSQSQAQSVTGSALFYEDESVYVRTSSVSTRPAVAPRKTMVYPLAHSPVSQDSFPMWSAGAAQAQVPVQQRYPQSILRPAPQNPLNSETVI